MLAPATTFRTDASTPTQKRLCILGASGSIGESTLKLVTEYPERFKAEAVSVHENIEKLTKIIDTFSPSSAVVSGLSSSAVGNEYRDCSISYGPEALSELAAHRSTDTVVGGVVGVSGLPSTLSALSAGKRIALANKESVVCGTPLLARAMQEGGGEIIPVDSEHASLMQCLYGRRREEFRALILTASGGPFLNRELNTLRDVTPEEAAAHPRWSMGRKVSIDSATLCNKALGLIEAHFLFGGIPIEVVIHPESLVHGMIALSDGTLLAHAGVPDMRAAIAFGLTHPERLPALLPPLTVTAPPSVHFRPVEHARFPVVQMAQAVVSAGGAMPLVFNAANEAAVALFCERRIQFTAIIPCIESALAQFVGASYSTTSELLALDQEVKTFVHQSLKR